VTYADEVVATIEARTPGETSFHQAVRFVAQSVSPVLEGHAEYCKERILERLAEPERAVLFRVDWVDDNGDVQVNRGYRVQMNSAIGPYKGGLRFHPTVDLGILKFLAFEQVFKNALTTLPMGGGKGGSDFDPKGKSDAEVRRFCQSFMTELFRHIGQFTDVPAGDIGVGKREIGYLFGQYKRITNQFTGVITGKGANWGGSLIRPEATGYGVVYFAHEMLATRGDSLDGKRCLVSGSGNVAQYTMQKLLALGAIPITMSDSDGFVVDPDGIDEDKLTWVLGLKNVRRGRVREYAERFPRATYVSATTNAGGHGIWDVPAACAFPCATQNEIGEVDAANLVRNGVIMVTEGANMPVTLEGVERLRAADVLYGPGTAANAGGVTVSGLEMAQDAEHLPWTREQVDKRLHEIMQSIHREVRQTAEAYGQPDDYVTGANIAGFTKVADAMLDEGAI
jgi:glutamate dehydrogenase (NADP+)